MQKEGLIWKGQTLLKRFGVKRDGHVFSCNTLCSYSPYYIYARVYTSLVPSDCSSAPDNQQ